MAWMSRCPSYCTTRFHRLYCNRNTLFLTGVWNPIQGSTNLRGWQHCIPHFTAGKTGFQWGNFSINFSRRPEKPEKLNCSSRTQEQQCRQILNPLTPWDISYSLWHAMRFLKCFSSKVSSNNNYCNSSYNNNSNDSCDEKSDIQSPQSSFMEWRNWSTEELSHTCKISWLGDNSGSIWVLSCVTTVFHVTD